MKMDSKWFIVYFSLTLALYIFTKHFLHKLRNLPPSPLLNFPLIGHLYLLKKPLYHTLAKISDRYGPVVLLQFGSRRVLHVSSPSIAEECLTKNDIIFANRPHLLAGKYTGYNYTSITWAPYGDHWRNLRKLSSLEILSMHRLQMLHGIRVDEIKSMIDRLNREAEKQRSVNMKVVFFEVTINVMMRMIAGKRYYGENPEDAEEAKKFREMIMEVFENTVETNWRDFLPVARWFGGGAWEKKFIELQKQKDEFMRKLIEECKRRNRNRSGESAQAGNQTKTMIEALLESQEKQPEYYQDELIKTIMLTLLVAGSDTTAGTLEWGLTHLLNNPQVLKKAQLEIDNSIGNERLIDESDIEKLPYLRGIVYETLRMCPIAPLLMPHESSEPCTVKGYHVPAGTILAVNAWAIQNDPNNWEDPSKFKPERFEGQEGKRDPFKLMTFGYGRRGCPGEGLAMRMLGAGLGSVIQCFDWERVGKDLVDTSTGSGITIAKSQPLMAYCRARPVVAKILS